jgi:hypothetical protein
VRAIVLAPFGLNVAELLEDSSTSEYILAARGNARCPLE